MAFSWDWVADSGGVRVGVTASRREATTSTVVIKADRGGGRALLVDPAWDPDELSAIAEDLRRRALTVTGFATHAHHDHVLWHPALGNGPRWASEPVVRQAAAQRAELVAALGSDFPPDLATLVGQLTPVNGQRLPWTGVDAELITHDAHARGHTALWLPDVRVLIAGDLLSDVEIPLLEGSTGADYRRGLDMLRTRVDRASVLIPGHGRPARGPAAAARWHADDRYLRDLLTGADPRDPRMSLPGMREAHADNVSRVTKTGEIS